MNDSASSWKELLKMYPGAQSKQPRVTQGFIMDLNCPERNLPISGSHVNIVTDQTRRVSWPVTTILVSAAVCTVTPYQRIFQTWAFNANRATLGQTFVAGAGSSRITGFSVALQFYNYPPVSTTGRATLELWNWVSHFLKH